MSAYSYYRQQYIQFQNWHFVNVLVDFSIVVGSNHLKCFLWLLNSHSALFIDYIDLVECVYLMASDRIHGSLAWVWTLFEANLMKWIKNIAKSTYLIRNTAWKNIILACLILNSHYGFATITYGFLLIVKKTLFEKR